ncbi:SIR2 family protein [Variovorax robiniae]|uniref:SIR2 family protein n=1 Tax=Variovorax robiniae TaxID=1836199 RepID=A0ABU8XKH2_9BURK
MTIKLQTADALAKRLARAVLPGEREVVFLMGSGVCLPDAEGRGVLGAKAIMTLIEAELGPDWQPTDSYQTAFEQLIEQLGEDAANRVVRKAVLQATADAGLSLSGKSLKDDDLRDLERNAARWHVPQGLRALSALVTHLPECFGRSILTTNFDPLIEIGLSKQAAPYFSSALHADGSLLYLSGVGTHVVHLHGFWRGSDTLHTSTQLSQDRPQLADSLRNILRNSTLAILGYGGWDDLFMRTLAAALAGNSDSMDILWGFHESDAADVHRRYDHVVETLSPATNRGRAQFFRGVSADTVLAEAFRLATERRPAQDVPTFMQRVELARTGRVRYAELARPWSDPHASLGEYAKLLYRIDPSAAIKAAVIAAEYLLPRLERQGVNAAPVTSEAYGYARKSIGRAWTLLESGDSDDPWLSGAVIDLCADSEKEKNNAESAMLLVVADAVTAVLAQVSGQEVYAVGGNPQNERGAKDFAAIAIHRAARVLHDDDGALWSYIGRRLGGGPDPFGRFW